MRRKKLRRRFIINSSPMLWNMTKFNWHRLTGHWWRHYPEAAGISYRQYCKRFLHKDQPTLCKRVYRNRF